MRSGREWEMRSASMCCMGAMVGIVGFDTELGKVCG